jgi:molybdopterin-biosynthesis enzyme MoeA-like protein
MFTKPAFYSIIIGTELLNGRRKDSHFEFLNKTLINRGWEHKANFVIKDDVVLLENVYQMIQKDPDAVMFSFGGIGSTPDDFTREVAAKAFTGEGVVRHKEAEKIILQKLGERAYPHPIKMADLPRGAELIDNPINKMPGFQLDNRFFFVPGFPEMAHPMIEEVLDRLYPENVRKYSCNFVVEGSEAMLIDIMEKLPKELELSCLPAFVGEKRTAEIYLADIDKANLEKWCTFFKEELHKIRLKFKEI